MKCMVGVCVVGLFTGAIALVLSDASAMAGPFERATDPIDVGPMAGVPALADFDGDGDLDVVVACGRQPDDESGHAQVLLNDGHGKLTKAGKPIRIGPSAYGLAVGDLNGDGSPDFAVRQHDSYDVAILIGHGDGSFAAPTFVTLHTGDSPHVHGIAIADVNADGHNDLLATLVDDHALAVLLGDGAGSIQPALGQPYFAHRHPYLQINVADINGDGHVDAVMTDMRGGGLTVLVGSGTGMFAPSKGYSLGAHTPIETAERPMACDLGDIDGDGDLDAVVVFDESPLAARMINTGNGTFVEPANAAIRLARPSTGGRLVDVTGDGALDFIASTTQTEAISISPGNGDGTFGDAMTVDAGGEDPAIAIGDLNGDGRPDIVTGNYDGGSVTVLINRYGEKR